MQQVRFSLQGDYIELFKLLKFQNLSYSGAEAKMMIDEGLVYVNGECEKRKRAKIKPGDVVKIDEVEIHIEP